MFILMPVIFVLGILAIALEDKIKINKAAIALFMAISLWMILMLLIKYTHFFRVYYIYYKPFDCLSFRECIRNAFLCYVLHADCRYRG